MRISFGGIFRNKAGNTALVFALLTPLLILVAGGAIDVTNASMRQAQLQQAADAAAIGAVARNSPGFEAAVLMPGDGPIADSITQTNAQAIFNANWRSPAGTTPPTIVGASCGGATLVCKTGLVVSSKVAITSVFTTAFLGIFGQHTINLGVTSYASDNIPAYVNFYMLLDNTPSMGLGATTADITALQNMTANAPADKNCAFACHTTQDAAADYYDQARALGTGVITLRIDEVATATANLMQTATQTETQNGLPPPPLASGGPGCSAPTGPTPEFNVAIYDFGDQAFVAPAVKTVSLLQNCLTQSAADAGNVQLETVPTNNYAYVPPYVPPGLGPIINNNDTDTNFTNMLTNMTTTLGVAGTGINATSPEKVLFFVTDGMTDSPVGGRSLGGLDSSACTSMKNNGVKIAILYTTYLQSAIANDSFSQQYVIPTLPTVSPALQACASPGLFYEVNPSNGAISQAMAALFNKVLAAVKLTPPTS